MFRTVSVAAIIVGMVVQAGCGSQGVPRGQPASPMFSSDIAPVLFEHCSRCHRPGQAAPFSVLEYGDAKRHAKQIAAATESRIMPPWLPEPGYGDFINQRRLRNDQIELIQQWARQGAPEGNPADLPPTPHLSEGWQLGKPDLILEMPEPYVLQPREHDVFRNFVLPTGLAAPRYVRGLEFRADNSAAVHHAVIGLDGTGESRRLDDEDAELGYDGMRSAIFGPVGHFLSWTPGKVPFMQAPDMAWRLDRGSDVVVQLHMMPSAKARAVRARVGLFFTDATPTRTPFLVRMGSSTIDIPAGEANYEVSDTYVLPVDVEVLSVYPHAHYLAKDMKAFATLPDGTVKWLIWIKAWDFRWQDEYRYSTPIFLSKGTRLTMRYVYDNSSGNGHNPHHPPERVVYGPQSSDEMAKLWLQVLLRSATDLPILVREDAERELRSQIAASEQAVKRTPQDATARGSLGAAYLQAGRLEEAVAQLQMALQIAPQHAEAHNNLGTALQSQGRQDEAIRHFRRALQLLPRDYRVHFNLANALQALGQTDEAIRQFREALVLNSDFADAHNNLGLALGSRFRIDEAIIHFREALAINPRDADTHNNLGVALLMKGEQREAETEFRQALDLRPNHADAQRNLSVLKQRPAP